MNEKNYKETLLDFITWLRYDSKAKLLEQLHNQKPLSTWIKPDTMEDGRAVDGVKLLSNLEYEIAKIEFIIKTLNKHKALLEASKGIE